MVHQASTDIVDKASKVLHPGIGSLPSITGTSAQGFFWASVHDTKTGRSPYSRDGTIHNMSRDQIPSSIEPYPYIYPGSANTNRAQFPWDVAAILYST